MKKVRLFFFLFGVLAFIGFALFPVEIFLLCAEFQAVRFCKKTFGVKPRFEKVSLETGKIVFKNGCIDSEDYQISFSKASFKPSFNWREREIGGKLKLEGFRLVNQKKETHILPHFSTPSSTFFSLNLKTSIKKGEVFLYEYEGFSSLFQHYVFDLSNFTKGKKTLGWIEFSPKEGEKKWVVHYWRDVDSVLRLLTKFQSHSFPKLYDLITYLMPVNQLPPSAANWHFTHGELNGNLDLSLLHGEPYRLSGNLSISNLHAENNSLEIFGEVDSLQASLDVDFMAIKLINGEFSLQGGRLALQENNKFWHGIWDLGNLQTTICVKEGSVESSVLKGNFMGMAGDLVLDWNSSDVLMQMGFKGSSQELITLFPSSFQSSFKGAFADDHFSLAATLKRAGDGLELEGDLSIANEETHHLQFGCLFGLNREDHLPNLPDSPSFSLSGSVNSFLGHLANQFCLSQKRFGWFQGKQFPLEKFLSPFLFRDVRMEASGRADFEGTFDDRYLVISYWGNDISLESPHFSLKVDSIAEEKAKEGEVIHYIDLQTWNHLGFLPLKEAKYYQKNRELLFTQADAVVYFENNSIRIQNIHANWQQLVFGGEIDLCIHNIEDVDLKIQANYLKGPASDAQQFLTHFSHSIFWDIPILGEVVSEGEVFSFHYHFAPEAKLISGELQGNFAGILEKPSASFSGHVRYDLKDIFIDIDSSLGTIQGTIGNQILLEGDHFQLRATQFDNGLNISECSYKSWNAKGELIWNDYQIMIEDGVIKNSQGECFLKGTYNRNANRFKGKIQSLKWNFNEELSTWKPKGEIFGSGDLEWNLQEGVQVHLAASFRNLAFSGIHFGDGKDLSCFYSSQFGLAIEGLEVEIPTENGIEKYKLGRFSYDFTKQNIIFDGFDFCLPPEKLPWVSEFAGTLFPGKFHATVLDWVEAIKQNEPLEGRISLEIYPESIWVYLSLKDGTYYVSGKKLHLKNFLLLYDPLELNIWTQCFYRDDDYWMHLKTDTMTMSHGKFAISERMLSLNHPASSDSLIVDWERKQGKGWLIQQVQGNFHGVHADLCALNPWDFSDHIDFKGQIDIDGPRVFSLMGEKFSSIAKKFALSGKYVFDGILRVSKSDFSHSSFQGRLTGSDMTFKGIEISSITSNLYCNRDQLTLSEVLAKDWAGRLTLKQADLMRKNEIWELKLDTLKLEDVRLSRLRSPWTRWTARDKPFYRSFLIRKLDLNEFRADLGDPSSFGGRGIFEFTNLPKRNFLSSLFLIPTEITARIGLDLSNLIPARGKIDYEIRDNKIYLNEFREMYSEGKRSRFYLAEGTKAYVDFAGHLNFKLKMKQYNLLMKLAEFFTITVKGTLFHPTYTLSNQFEDE